MVRAAKPIAMCLIFITVLEHGKQQFVVITVTLKKSGPEGPLSN
jgi:hypothetical protein